MFRCCLGPVVQVGDLLLTKRDRTRVVERHVLGAEHKGWLPAEAQDAVHPPGDLQVDPALPPPARGPPLLRPLPRGPHLRSTARWDLRGPPPQWICAPPIAATPVRPGLLPEPGYPLSPVARSSSQGPTSPFSLWPKGPLYERIVSWLRRFFGVLPFVS